MAERRASTLPPSLAPRGLSRSQAAEYVGISPSLFDEMVKDGRMPAAKCVNSRRVWGSLQPEEASAPQNVYRTTAQDVALAPI